MLNWSVTLITGTGAGGGGGGGYKMGGSKQLKFNPYNNGGGGGGGVRSGKSVTHAEGGGGCTKRFGVGPRPRFYVVA